MRRVTHSRLRWWAIATVMFSFSFVLPFHERDGAQSLFPIHAKIIPSASPVEILGNGDLVSFPGSGNQGDPYIIEDMVIDGNGTDFALNITNVDKFLLIQNVTFFNVSGGAAVYLNRTANILFQNCTFSTVSGSMGLFIDNSTEIRIMNGDFIQNDADIFLKNSTLVDIHHSTLGKGGLFVSGSTSLEYDHDVYNTTTNGKPILYIKNAINQVFNNLNISQFFCINSTNVTISNIHVQNSNNPVVLFQVNGSCMQDCSFTNGTLGCYVTESSFNSFSRIQYYRVANPFVMERSNGNVLYALNATAAGATGNGISLEKSNDNVLEETDLTGYGVGARAKSSNRTLFSGNRVINCTQFGLELEHAINSTVVHSLFSGSGLHAVNLKAGTVDIQLYNNEFIDNNLAYPTESQALDVGTDNTWDDGKGRGNYWSNFELVNPSAVITANNTWNVTYPIDGFPGHEDRFPLVNGSAPRALPGASTIFARPSVEKNVTWTVKDNIAGGHYAIWENGTQVSAWIPWDVTEADIHHAINKTTESTWNVVLKYNNSRGVFGDMSLRALIVDGTPPAISLNVTNNSILHTGTQVNVSIVDTNLDLVLFNWDGGTNQTLFAPYLLTIPDIYGLHVLRIFARDAAGNEASVTFSFTLVDATNATDWTVIIIWIFIVSGIIAVSLFAIVPRFKHTRETSP